MSLKVPSLGVYLKNQAKWDDYIRKLRKLQWNAAMAFLGSEEGKNREDWQPEEDRKQSDCIAEEPETCDGYVFKNKHSFFVCNDCYEHFGHKLFHKDDNAPDEAKDLDGM
jgi:hypothetical protein